MMDYSCLFAPCPAPSLRKEWRQEFSRELARLRERGDLLGDRCALGWIHHARACTLRNIRLSQSCLVLVLEGEKTLLSGGTRQGAVEEGGALFVPAGESVSCINTPAPGGDYLALTVSFSSQVLNSVRQRLAPGDAAPSDRSKVEAARDITPLLGCVYAFLRYLPVQGDPMLALMQQEQMVYILWKSGVPVFAGPHRLVSEIRSLVEAAPHYGWSAPELADRLFMSERTLRRHLGELGTSPSELVRVSRLHYGLGLLMREGMAVSEAASRCGYSSPSRFAARFQELFGLSPAKVASSCRKAPAA